MQNRKLQNLQILRGISALLVCCFHARKFLNGDIEFGEILFINGSIGVPIFFIISGFIMVYTTKELPSDAFKNVKDFLFKRIIRVIPLYYILTILFLLITNSENFINDGIIRVLKVFLFIPTGNYPPLYVGWTLNYEMFFYATFGISLMFKNKRYVFLYSIFAILIFIIPLFNNGFISLNSKSGHDVKTYLELMSHPILLQFLLGVFIGNILPKFSLSDSIIKLGVFLTTLLFCLYYFNIFKFVFSDLIICGLLVFSIILLDQSNVKFTKPRLLIYFGDISYSIYLVHPIIILFLPRLFAKIGLIQLVESKLFFLIILIFTILSSAILYKLIEKRLTSYLRNKFINSTLLNNGYKKLLNSIK